VPTFTGDPDEGGDEALLEGTVSPHRGRLRCPGARDLDHGALLPNARGHRGDYPGGAPIFSTFPELEAVMAKDGAEAAYGGGVEDLSSELGADWQRLCPASPVDELFQVYDTDPSP